MLASKKIKLYDFRIPQLTEVEIDHNGRFLDQTIIMYYVPLESLAQALLAAKLAEREELMVHRSDCTLIRETLEQLCPGQPSR
jgi:hypothetical protein